MIRLYGVSVQVNLNPNKGHTVTKREEIRLQVNYCSYLLARLENRRHTYRYTLWDIRRADKVRRIRMAYIRQWVDEKLYMPV